MKNRGVLAFGFGSRLARSNRLIEEVAENKAQELKAPIFTQRDIEIEKGIRTEYLNEVPGKGSSTLQFVKEAVKWAIANNIEELWVVAAPPHCFRCVRDLQKVIKRSSAKINIRISKRTGQYPSSNWFCSNSEQLRTQIRLFWWPREVILRIMPFWLYDLLTG